MNTEERPARLRPEDVFPPSGCPAPGSRQHRYAQARLDEVGRWGDESLARTIARHARERPDREAYVGGEERMTWRAYDERSTALAGGLVAAGVQRGDRLAVLMEDGPGVHVAYVAAEKAGATVVGIGPRAGAQEIAHLLGVTSATGILTGPQHRGHDAAALLAEVASAGGAAPRHLVVDGDRLLAGGAEVALPAADEVEEEIGRRQLGVGELFMLNSTSGTTGMPKCVVHNQSRWIYYHTLALDAGEFTDDDRFMGLIPAPYGFGLWTAHVTPTLMGCPTVVMPRFDAAGALELIERERVTVVSCVSTQFIMMLNDPSIGDRDLTSLRCMFTGGEAVPYQRAAEFEEQTGARVLQFYGSNETGALSYTSMRDSREHRLDTGGRVIDAMHVQLFDDDGTDVTSTGGPGQAGCEGPATCLGYYGDEAANDELISEGGVMMTGDIVTIDADGYLRVVGRKSDFIIRGGKNISAVAVEEQVGTHPAVSLAAAVAMPDPVFGERVCAYVVLHPGEELTLERLIDHLEGAGVSKETLPEHLVVVDELPQASGGKIAKGKLRADIRRRLELQDR